MSKKIHITEVVASNASVLSDLQITIAQEASRLKSKSKTTNGLSTMEVRSLKDLVNAQREVQKELDTQRQRDLISQLSDEEIQELFKKQAQKLLTGDSNGTDSK